MTQLYSKARCIVQGYRSINAFVPWATHSSLVPATACEVPADAMVLLMTSKYLGGTVMEGSSVVLG